MKGNRINPFFTKENARENGKKGGRPVLEATTEAAAFRKILYKKIKLEQGPVVDALIFKAKQGDVPAIREVLERILGKVTTPLDISGTKRIIAIDD